MELSRGKLQATLPQQHHVPKISPFTAGAKFGRTMCDLSNLFHAYKHAQNVGLAFAARIQSPG